MSAKPGTAELEPLLATEWKASEDGKSYTFTLREGVKFSDGTDFNAEAVCANFDRWYNWTGVNQSENLTYYYGKLFAATRPARPAASTTAARPAVPTEATVTLTKPFAAFVQAMTLPAFSMQSPTAMKEYNADDVRAPRTTSSGLRVRDPAPRRHRTVRVREVESADQQVTLKRNDTYWGDKAKVEKVIIRTISDPKARTQELQAGQHRRVRPAGPGGLAAV